MLRKMQNADLDKVMDIWLAANLEAHSFVPADYWQSNLPAVRQALPQAEVYVYADAEQEEILGFIGLDGDYIAGIFVTAAARSRGIGKELLDYAKSLRPRLTLQVYRQNERAVQFYQREGFRVNASGLDTSGGAAELHMCWPA